MPYREKLMANAKNGEKKYLLPVSEYWKPNIRKWKEETKQGRYLRIYLHNGKNLRRKKRLVLASVICTPIL